MDSGGHLDNGEAFVVLVGGRADVAEEDRMAADAAEGVAEKLADLAVPEKAQTEE